MLAAYVYLLDEVATYGSRCSMQINKNTAIRTRKYIL